jgi:cytochrome c oxidase cbb3-type subunit 3
MDAPALQSRFLYPRAQQSFGPAAPIHPKSQPTVTVTLPSGETFSGNLSRIDDFSVSLIDQTGQQRSWLLEPESKIKVQVNNPLQPHIDLLKQYSNADMHNILAYLETFK